MKKLFFLNLMIIFTAINLFAAQVEEKNNCCFSKIDDSDLFRRNEKVVFLNTEFLYWTASCASNEYAFQYDRAITQAGKYHGLGKYIFSKYGWDPGFRVAIGWFNAPNTYQVFGQFTWIKLDNTKTSNRTEPFSLNATFPQFVQQLGEAKSKIKVNYEIGDFLASRVWFPNLHCRLRLFGGFTGGRIQQKWDITYTDLQSQIEKVYNKWKFTAVGLRLGIDIDWFFTSYFYLTGKVSFAPFVGKYRYLGQIQDQNDLQRAFFKYDQYRGSYNVQAYIGPSYQRAFCKNRFEIFVGYELNNWFNVNEKIINVGVTDTNYLTGEVAPIIDRSLFLLHGLTARLTFDF